MDESQIRELVRQLDTTDRIAQEQSWAQLRPLGDSVVAYLEEFYPKAKKMEGRAHMVYHAVKHARTSEAAFRLAVAALNDRASVVRYRACSILAYSLRQDALLHLEVLAVDKDPKTAQDARAAMDAIRHQNHHFFVDRGHTGKMFWEVNEGDRDRL